MFGTSTPSVVADATGRAAISELAGSGNAPPPPEIRERVAAWFASTAEP